MNREKNVSDFLRYEYSSIARHAKAKESADASKVLKMLIFKTPSRQSTFTGHSVRERSQDSLLENDCAEIQIH